MYKNLFKICMKTEPPDTERLYIFLVNDPELAGNIVCQGMYACCINANDQDSFSEQEFYDYMDEIAFMGTCRGDYTYVPATDSKRLNDDLEKYLKKECLNCRSGWKLFKGKPYLGKLESGEELKSILLKFISAYESPKEYDPGIEKFHTVGENGKPLKVLDLNIAEDILSAIPFFAVGDSVFVYKSGVYQEDVNGIRLKAEIQKRIAREKVNQPTINRIYQLLLIQPAVHRTFSDLYNYPSHWVNFRNGFYDPIEEKFIEHDPKYLSINQIPYEFHPEKFEEIKKQSANIRSYLEFSIPDPVDQAMLWEYLGYCMTADTQFQKFLMLLGDGGTGKSVVIDMVENLVGKENCSHISLQDLNKRFYATSLFGKILNSCGDIPCKAMDQTDGVKKATGEDMLLFEHKKKDPLFFRSHAKLLFSANDMPENLEEKSDAFYRRLLILDINRKIPEAKKDTQLKSKIRSEMDYAVHMAMQGLSRLYKSRKFSESDHSIECVQNIQRSSDSVKAFTDECLQRKDGMKIAKSIMYQLYEDFCKEYDRMKLGKKRFFNVMERKGFESRKSNGIFYYFDVMEKETDFEPVQPGEYVPFEDDRDVGWLPAEK